MRIAEIFNAVAELGETYDFESGHARQVTKLALRLFDDLQPLHGMGNTERIWLRAAAMLHDIVKAHDPRRHHKLARDIIIDARELPFRKEERIIIGLVAGYHCGSLPSNGHKFFADLDADARLYVKKMASLLRLADALDKGHLDLVENLQCCVRQQKVLLRIISRHVPNIDSIFRKADLFKRVFRKRIAVHVSVGRSRWDATIDSDAPQVYADTN